ncbi:MAG: protein kinase [Deltaproteobacteria bacterium]
MQPGDLVGGRFELGEVAGSGGMGAVYRAVDRATGESVAVKVLREVASEHGDRFAREIRVLAQLRHPGIVRYIADGKTDNGMQWLVMEWLEGEPLGHRVRRTGIAASEAVALVRRVGEALGAAHDRGVVHRDVKPSNLFVVRDDLARVKLLDFGVARVGDGDRFATRTGVMIGTPGYMAPEQARGDRNVGPRADVFALGCVLFELLTGEHAFVGDNVMAVLAKILLEDARRVAELRPELPHELDELVSRTLSKQAEDRPADGAALAAALAAFGTLEAIEIGPITPRKSLTTSERRLLSVVLIGADKSGERPARGNAGGGAEVSDNYDTIAESVADSPTVTAQDISTEGESVLPMIYASLRATALEHGATLERLVDGSHVVTVVGGGSAGDQAMQAARCALALKQVAPTAPMALATGRGVLAGRWPVGEAIDRAARLLGKAAAGVRVDDVTAGLLDVRFELGGDAAGLVLIAERDVVETARTLLGKSTPCVGRDRELGALVGLYEECISEPIARAVVVVGAAGIGKSRVRVEVLRRVHAMGEPVEVWIGRGDPLRAGSPYGMIAPALRRSGGIRDGEPVEVRRQKLRARVLRNASAPLEKSLLFLGELIGAPFDDDDHPQLRAARHDPLLMAEQIRQAFVHFVTTELAAQPLVVVLEDLHWGDLPSVKLIDAALRELIDRPLFVLALAREQLVDLEPKLWIERGAHELRLDELTKKGSERLVRGVLGDTATDALVARLVEQAAGNAFYLEELIRATAEGKGDAMPETVLAVVQSRLERLELDARRVLRAASVFGQRFWRGGVMALLGDAARATGTEEWLDELCERELVARIAPPRFPGQDELQFRHSLVREAAYAMLTDADRRLGHQLAGEWLAAAGEADPVALADHFERGGDGPRAAVLHRAAAEQALAACDFRGALARCGRAVACDGESGLIALVRAEAHRWLGELAESATHARAALAALPRGTVQWFAAANEACEASGKLGDRASLEAVAELLREAPSDRTTLGARVTATANAAFQLFSYGSHALAQVLLDLVEHVAPAVEEPAILARIYQARSSRSMFTGDAGAYLESELAAFAAFERAGDLRYACVQRGHVGYAWLELGAYAEAEEALRDALARATALGLPNVVATAKHNLGRALAARGELVEAARVEAEAVAAFDAQGDRRLTGGARLYLGAIYYEQGEFAAAEREVALALASSQLPMQAQMRATLARILLASGRVVNALGEAHAAMAILDELGAIEEGEALVRLVLAEALLGSDRRDEARAVIGVAGARLLARAERISDPRYRKSFVERIADHARTIELATRLR